MSCGHHSSVLPLLMLSYYGKQRWGLVAPQRCRRLGDHHPPGAVERAGGQEAMKSSAAAGGSQVGAFPRPMGVGDILDETFRLLRRYLVAFVGIAAVLEIPRQVIFTAITLSAPAPILINRSVTGLATTAAALPQISGAWVAATAVGTVISLLLGILVNGALAVAISQGYLGRQVSIGAAYAVAWRRLGTLLAAGLLAIIFFVLLYAAVLAAPLLVFGLLSVLRLTALGVVALIVGLIGGLVVFLRIVVGWTLVSQVVVLEHSPALAAFRRSAALVAGYRWKTIGVLVVSWLLLAVLLTVPTILSGALFGLGHVDATAAALLNGLIGLVFGVVLTPIPLAATTLLFYDLKIRKEAFDLEMLAGQLSGVSAPAS